MLEVSGENPFRIRAYQKASRLLSDMGESVAEQVERGDDLTSLPGIGKDLAAKIVEIVKTGTLSALQTLHETFPPEMTDLLKLPGLGPKKLKLLYDELGITTLAQLEQAARAGKLRELPGVAAKTEERLLKAIAYHVDMSQRFLRAEVRSVAESLQNELAKVDPSATIQLGGSYRRQRDTVGDLDLVVASNESAPWMDALTRFADVQEVLAKGETKTSVRLQNGLQVDLRVVAPESFGAALCYFTGSKAHNIALRKQALSLGYRLNEYGLTREQEMLPMATEEELYEHLEIPFVPPELREDRGEFQQSVPELVTEKDIQGDLHMHTVASDGRATIREMAEAALARGLSYIAITDHSKRLTIANGLDEGRLSEQIDEIDEINATLDGLTILKGSEVDILQDGSMDLSNEVLQRLDLVIGAVHSGFDLSRDAQTERILRAMDNACFSVLAHPTGRRLLLRDAYEVDLARILNHAADRSCFVELNANPQRLDLHDIHCRMAKERGVLVGIHTDAHRVKDLDNLPYGVGQARRGWLEKMDVLNTRSLPDLLNLLQPTIRMS